ncbi:MAG: hypothetical protein QM783_07760 [Phycisphaerales bacterium]
MIEPLALPGQVFSEEDRACFERARAGEAGLEADTARLFLAAVERARTLIERLHEQSNAGVGDAHVLIVRGAFWKQHPWTGARGERIAEAAAALGVPCTVVDTPSLGTLEHNAARVACAVAEHAEQRVVVVSLSKGSADVKAALSGPAAGCVAAWLDLSGTTEGTPVVEQVRSVWWRWTAVRVILAARRQPAEALTELHLDNKVLARPVVLPRGVPHVRVLAFPLRRHLSCPWAERAYARLEKHGPNDGGGVLLKPAAELAARGNSTVVLPVWGADHYLRPQWSFDSALAALLRLLCAARQGPAHQ